MSEASLAWLLIVFSILPFVYTLSGITDNALAWHSEGRVFAPYWLQQVLRVLARICTLKYEELGGIDLYRMGGTGQSVGSTVSDAIVRSWLLGYFNSITASS